MRRENSSKLGKRSQTALDCSWGNSVRTYNEGHKDLLSLTAVFVVVVLMTNFWLILPFKLFVPSD